MDNKTKALQKKYYAKDPSTKQAYFQANKEALLQKSNEYHRKRYKDEPEYKQYLLVKRRLNRALKEGIGFPKELNIALSEYKDGIEDRLLDGMNWDNRSEWFLQLIVPWHKFDLSEVKDCQKCFHYSNMKPVWKKADFKAT